MARAFGFELLTPDRVVLEAEVEAVVMRTEGGDIAFLADHVQFIGQVQPCLLRALRPDQGELVAAVHGGFVEVRQGRVRVLAPVAELPGEIDVARAEQARERARAALAADEADAEAEAALARAEARLAAASRA
jgi:F-type H+-transporting ATPase subunit epsilon